MHSAGFTTLDGGIEEPFEAYVVERMDGSIVQGVRMLDADSLPPGEVTVRVEWSGLNHKDAMVTEVGNRVARINPLVPGVDLAGTVVESRSAEHPLGSRVIAHGFDIGVSRHGGFSRYARLPAQWVIPLPAGMSTREAMVAGTAGFTAVASANLIESHGTSPCAGPVLVTGASGGVGCFAVAVLASRGFEVVASTGKSSEASWLRELGAAQVIGREDLEMAPERVLAPETFAGAVDCVGGHTLALVARSLCYGAAVAASGIVGGSALEGTLFPFITRGITLYGVDTVLTPRDGREAIWQRLGEDLFGIEGNQTAELTDLLVDRETDLSGLPVAIGDLLSGHVRGRVLVRPTTSPKS